MARPPVPEHADWQPVGTTANTEYRAPKGAPDILIVLPEAGLRDDATSARMNMDFQTAYVERVGRKCVVTNALSRAIGSFFLGLSQPSVPTKMHADFEKAIAWAESQRPADAAITSDGSRA